MNHDLSYIAEPASFKIDKKGARRVTTTKGKLEIVPYHLTFEAISDETTGPIRDGRYISSGFYHWDDSLGKAVLVDVETTSVGGFWWNFDSDPPDGLYISRMVGGGTGRVFKGGLPEEATGLRLFGRIFITKDWRYACANLFRLYQTKDRVTLKVETVGIY